MKYRYFFGLLVWIGCLVPMCIAAAAPQDVVVIALDPGHGGAENGAEYYDMREQDLNYKMAEFVKQEMEQYTNVEVVLTREEGEEVSLAERAKRAKEENADILISLHFNASTSHDSNGSSVYITTGDKYRETLMDFADYFLGEFEALGLTNGGTFARVTQMGGRREDGTFDDYYGIIRHAYNYDMPGMIVEHCYLDSETDLPFFESDTGLQNLAAADARAIAAYYDLKTADGESVTGTHAKHYLASDAAVALDYYEAPQITGIRLSSYDGLTPGQAAYEIGIQDEVGITFLYLVYQNNVTGETFTIYPALQSNMTTGTFSLTAYLPEDLELGMYHLCYIGANNAAGYDVGYNLADGEMIGFGKCQWQNRFSYDGTADLTVMGEGSVEDFQLQRVLQSILEGWKEKMRLLQ